ncbi:MAG: phosphatidate cytidylyltransferase, partial [Clostridia bacterium]|nr:phosphatidate cytidylyltransferase [Clostridia bacterium]
AGSYTDMQIWLPVYLFVGLAVSVVTAFGDLTESAIKRKLDIKDMGKIMPGHGGALDRLDGVFFSTVTVYLVYSVIVLFV